MSRQHNVVNALPSCLILTNLSVVTKMYFQGQSAFFDEMADVTALVEVSLLRWRVGGPF